MTITLAGQPCTEVNVISGTQATCLTPSVGPAEVGLAERITHRPAELSGGEQQRVAVARALMNNPAIVLADEPSGNLDEVNSEKLHGLIFDLSRSKNQTFVVVTHKRELLTRADRGFVLEGGKLLPAER